MLSMLVYADFGLWNKRDSVISAKRLPGVPCQGFENLKKKEERKREKMAKTSEENERIDDTGTP